MTHTDRRGRWLVCVGLRMAIKTQLLLLTCFKAERIHTKLMGFMSAPDNPRPLETKALLAVEREDANDVEMRSMRTHEIVGMEFSFPEDPQSEGNNIAANF